MALPTGKSFEPIVEEIKRDHEKANTQLKQIYDNEISDLTIQKKIEEAMIVKDEMQLVFRNAKLLRPIRKNGYFQMGEMGDGAGVVVRLTQPFELGICEVTQGQWKSVMGSGQPPWVGKNGVQIGDAIAASYVSWDEATEFCKKLTARERKSGTLKAGKEYRLPTEAQWEYACRAGTETAFSFGDDPNQLGQYGWFDGNAKNGGQGFAHIIRQKRPNRWGLFDMHGNVWEWCSDWYGEKLSGGTDPVGPNGGSFRVSRGGGWWSNPGLCRSAFRGYLVPSYRNNDVGFRVARSQSAQ